MIDKSKTWWNDLPIWQKIVFFAAAGLILSFLCFKGWSALSGVFLGIFGIKKKKEKEISKQRDRADDEKRKLDSQAEEKIEKERKKAAIREKVAREKQESEDHRIENEARTDTPNEKKRKLMEDVDELLGEE